MKNSHVLLKSLRLSSWMMSALLWKALKPYIERSNVLLVEHLSPHSCMTGLGAVVCKIWPSVLQHVATVYVKTYIHIVCVILWKIWATAYLAILLHNFIYGIVNEDIQFKASRDMRCVFASASFRLETVTLIIWASPRRSADNCVLPAILLHWRARERLISSSHLPSLPFLP